MILLKQQRMDKGISKMKLVRILVGYLLIATTIWGLIQIL